MRCTRRFGRLAIASLVLMAVMAQSCQSPLGAIGPGLVRVELGSGRAVPSTVAAVELTVKADDMATLSVALAAPSFAASVEVPSGKARLFSIQAKDAAGVVRYAGEASLDVKGGKAVDLAISVAAVYRLTYNGNGAASGSPPADPSYYLAGATATVLGNTGALALPGRVLEGWTQNAAGSGTVYKPGDSLTMPASDLTLYAKWIYPVYTITYHLNGGGTHSNPSTYTEASLPLALTPATWGVNPFDKWYADPGLTVPLSFIAAGTNGNLDLYAGWLLPTFSFDPNGGTGSMAPQQAPAGDNVTIATITFSRPGYVPLGWNTAPNGTGTHYDLDQTVPMPGSNFTLHAQWDPITYTINFDAQGGTPALTPRSVDFGTAYGSPPAVTRTGYTLERWNTAANGSGTDITGGTVLSIPSDHTVYAIWTQNIYAVHFDANGADSGIMPDQMLSFNSSQALTVNVYGRTGHTFIGWNTAADGSGTPYADGATFTMSMEGQTLFARWSINSYTVSYDANGASIGNIPAPVSGAYLSSVSAAANTGNLQGPVIQDGIRQRFVGWNTASNGSGTQYLPGAAVPIPAGNLTLFAVYTVGAGLVGKLGPAGGYVFYDKGSVSDGWRYLEIVPTHHASAPNWSNITDANAGTASGYGMGVYNAMRIMNQAGHSSSVAKLCDDFTRTFNALGFSDWYLPSDTELLEAFTALPEADRGTNALWTSTEVSATGARAPSPSNTAHNLVKTQSAFQYRSIRAFSDVEQRFIVYYLPNEADGGTPPSDAMRYGPAASITISGPGSLTRTGHTFSRWNTKPDGSGTDYNPGTATMPNDNLVLYAIWQL